MNSGLSSGWNLCPVELWQADAELRLESLECREGKTVAADVVRVHSLQIGFQELWHRSFWSPAKHPVSFQLHCGKIQISGVFTFTVSHDHVTQVQQQWKKHSEEKQTLRAGRSKAEPKIAPRRRPSSWGRETAKI